MKKSVILIAVILLALILVLVVVLFLLYRIVASVTASQPVAIGAVVLAVGAFIFTTLKKRNKG